MLKQGYVLADKYEILKQLGRGGFSTVYLAMNQMLNQQWVIKEVRKDIDPAALKRVMREAKIMIGFDYPMIPRITEIIESEEATYIVMDYVSGKSLAYELKANGPMPQETVVKWGIQICDVMNYLHSQDPPIIYHDLKPGNIILKEPEHNLKLLDFGEARPLINGDAPGGGKTKQYAAPEQQTATRGPTDQRTDIYCIGTTLYRLLTGEFPPMPPETVGSVRQRFPSLGISKGMDNIIRKCTSHDPNKRFQSALELKKALENMELWDEDYIKRQKRKIWRSLGAAIAAVVCLVGGIAFSAAAKHANSQTYESLVATSYDNADAVNNYLEAISIDGTNPGAYMKLVELFSKREQFGDQQSQILTSAYDSHKNGFNMSDIEMQGLNYQIGKLYFTQYVGDNNSFRSRVLKAESYFSLVVEHGGEEFENYRLANAYDTICRFFESFVLSENSVQEPTEEDYRQFIAAMDTCISDMQSYKDADAAYTRLTLYQRLLEVIRANARGMVVNGITRDEARSLVTNVKTAIRNESVTQEKSLALQEELKLEADNVLEDVEREYNSVKGGG